MMEKAIIERIARVMTIGIAESDLNDPTIADSIKVVINCKKPNKAEATPFPSLKDDNAPAVVIGNNRPIAKIDM